MAERDWRGEFDKVESDANSLVEILQDLLSQVAEFKGVNETLKEGAAAIENTANGLGDVTPQLETLISDMKALGTPELRGDVDQLQTQIATLETQANEAEVARQASDKLQLWMVVGGVLLLAVLEYFL
jgi:hypothetical protein